MVWMLSLLCSTPAAAQAVHADDFANADGWSPVSGSWAVEDGAYCQTDIDDNGGQTPYGYDQMTIGVYSIPIDDFVLTTRATLLDTIWGGWWGYVFRYQDPSNYEAVLLYTTGDGSEGLWVDYWTFIDDDWTFLDTGWVDADPYAEHVVSADILGDEVTLLVDGDEVIRMVGSALPSGQLGLYTERTVVCFDDWTVSCDHTTVDQLPGHILDMGLPNGAETPLVSIATGAADAHSSKQAEKKLDAFQRVVAAKRGHQLTDAEADLLDALAQCAKANL